jgi:hypothetical protein
LSRKKFIIVAFVTFIIVNLAFSTLLDLLISSDFTDLLLQSLFAGITFLFLFILIARSYLSPTPPKFWLKLTALLLGFFSLYVILTMVIGEPIISAMGLQTTPLPAGSLLTESEFRILSLYTYALSSTIIALTSFAIAYFLQKYLIHYFYHGLKLVTKYQNYLEIKTSTRKTSFWIDTFWLILLPFPIQQALSPNTLGASIVGTAFYLPAALALFVLWGLKLTGLVGITKTKVFRIYESFHGALLGFIVFQWLSVLVYSLANVVVFQDVLVRLSYLLIRSIFTFGPQALITVYLFKTVLESRAQANIVKYLKQKDNLATAEIKVMPIQEAPKSAK